MQDRLAATNLKMSDLRNQIQSVKQELRVAQKVFQSQASSHLVWLGPALGRGRTGTVGSTQDQRVLGPVSIHALGHARDRNFLPLALETDPLGEWGCWRPRHPEYMPL